MTVTNPDSPWRPKKGKRMCADCGVKYAQGTTGRCAGCLNARIGDTRPAWNDQHNLGRPKKKTAGDTTSTSWWVGLDRAQLSQAATDRFATRDDQA